MNTNIAFNIKKGLETRLGRDDDFSGRDNFEIGKYLYENSNDSKDLIATAFNETPFYNGPNGDLASKYNGESFTRLAYEEFCDDKTLNSFKTAVGLENASLVIIPKGTDFTRIDGMFIKYTDNSCLAFESLHSTSGNRGIIFTGALAEKMYNYYSKLSESF
jgi:hypothetical protein